MADSVSDSSVYRAVHDAGTGVSVLDILRFFKSNILVIVLFATLSAGISGWYASTKPELYRAESLVTYTENLSGPGAASGAVDRLGLARIAGGARSPETQTSLATFKSRTFLLDFIETYGLKKQIFKDRWDAENQTWLPAKKGVLAKLKEQVFGSVEQSVTEPSKLETFSYFAGEILDITPDETGNFVTISVTWTDPGLAASWANGLVAHFNESRKQSAILEQKKNIQFLQEQVEKARLADIRLVLYKLIENKIKEMALAETRAEYSFTVIDAAMAPQWSSNKTGVIPLVFGFFVGFVLGAVVSLIRQVILAST